METRFLSHVEKTDDCWLWTGAKTCGYGRFGVGDKVFVSSRVAYELWVGEIPDGLVVRHKCRNRHCVNPEHLETGTQSENVADTLRDGTMARGEKMGSAKLTEDQVRDIRNRVNQTHQALADEFGVSRRTIGFIINRVNWAWLT